MHDLRSSLWLRGRAAGPIRRRIFCFPCAGGSPAPYMRWQPAMPPGTEICGLQLPGRGGRIDEPPCRDAGALITELAGRIRSDLDRPAILFGHSLGAILAFEIARRCTELTTLRHLIVAGCTAPDVWPSEHARSLATLDGQPLIDAIQIYNGTPPEIVGNDELMACILPVLRADFDLVASYRHVAAPALAIPVTVLVSRDDAHVPPATARDWQRHCSLPVAIHLFDGDHFFVDRQRDAVVALVSRIAAAMPEPGATVTMRFDS